jgi:hypothetical protein
LTASRIAGISTMEVAMPPCAAASWPVTCSASAPAACAASACFSVVTVEITLPPYACTRLMMSSPAASEMLTTGTFSSISTSAFSRATGISSVQPAPNGLSVSERI